MKPIGIGFLLFFVLMWVGIAVLNFNLILISIIALFALVQFHYKDFVIRELTYVLKEISKSGKSKQSQIQKLDVTKLYDYFSLSASTKPKEIKAVPIKSNKMITLFEPILSLKKLKRLDDMMIQYSKNSVIKSGFSENPRIVSRKIMAYSLLLFIISFPLSIILAFTFNLLFLGIIIMPLGYFMAKRMMIQSHISERETSIVYELPFFLTYTTIMESIKISLYSSMKGILKIEIPVFPIIKKECILLESFIEHYGNDFTKAIRYLAENYPNKDFRDFLNGYLFSSEGGGTTISELEKRSEVLFEKLVMKLENYGTSMGALFGGLQMAMIFAPLGIMMIGFMAPVGLTIQISLLAIMALPILTIFVILMVNSRQLKFQNFVKGNVLFLPVGFGVGIISFIISGEPWMGIGLGAFAAGFTNYLLNRSQLNEIEELESGTPEILKMLSNDKRSNIPFIDSFAKLKETKINESTSKLVNIIYTLLVHGKDMVYVVSKVPISSWLARFSYFNIARIQESGGGTAHSLYHLSLFLDEIDKQRQNLKAKLSEKLMFAYLGPVITIIIKILLVSALNNWAGDSNMSTIANDAMQMGIAGIDIAALSVPDELIDSLDVLLVISSISMGVIISKIYNGTLKNTLHMSLIVLVTTITLYLSPFIEENFIGPIF